MARRPKFLSAGWLVLVEAGALHAALRLGILHESIPDESSAVIFRHEQGNSRVNADHVGVVPIPERVEGIHESILAPCAPVAILDVVQHAYHGLGQKWQR